MTTPQEKAPPPSAVRQLVLTAVLLVCGVAVAAYALAKMGYFDSEKERVIRTVRAGMKSQRGVELAALDLDGPDAAGVYRGTATDTKGRTYDLLRVRVADGRVVWFDRPSVEDLEPQVARQIGEEIGDEVVAIRLSRNKDRSATGVAKTKTGIVYDVRERVRDDASQVYWLVREDTLAPWLVARARRTQRAEITDVRLGTPEKGVYTGTAKVNGAPHTVRIVSRKSGPDDVDAQLEYSLTPALLESKP